MNANPYAPPSAAPTLAGLPADADFATIAKSVFLAWEKLRLAYLAVLAAATLPLVWLCGAPWPAAIKVLLEGAVAANVLYFAGPALETYVCWLGVRGTWLRWVLFLGGTLRSLVLAGVVITAAFPAAF